MPHGFVTNVVGFNATTQALKASDARASDEGDGQDGAVCQQTEDCSRGANSAANVLHRSIGAEQRAQKSTALATFFATVAFAALLNHSLSC